MERPAPDRRQLSGARQTLLHAHPLPIRPIYTYLFFSEKNLDFFFDTSVYKVQRRKQTRFP